MFWFNIGNKLSNIFSLRSWCISLHIYVKQPPKYLSTMDLESGLGEEEAKEDFIKV